jgi:6-phosphogluconolactonase (cycloisomerase 2 family)
MQFSAGGPVQALIGHTSGNFVYAATPAGIAAFRIDSSGSLTPLSGSPFPLAGANPTDMTVTKDGAQLLVVFQDSSLLASYPIDSSSGGLGSAMTVSTGARPVSLTLDSSGKFVYVTNLSAVSVSAFNANGLTSIASSPFDVTQQASPTGGPTAIAAAGSFLYIFSAGEILGYSVDASSGAITQLAEVRTSLPTDPHIPDFLNVMENLPHGMVADPQGQFLVTNSSAPSTSPNFVYILDVTSNGLLAGANNLSEPESSPVVLPLAIDHGGKFAYRFTYADPNCLFTTSCTRALEPLAVGVNTLSRVGTPVTTGTSTSKVVATSPF